MPEIGGAGSKKGGGGEILPKKVGERSGAKRERARGTDETPASEGEKRQGRRKGSAPRERGATVTGERKIAEPCVNDREGERTKKTHTAAWLSKRRRAFLKFIRQDFSVHNRSKAAKSRAFTLITSSSSSLKRPSEVKIPFVSSSTSFSCVYTLAQSPSFRAGIT